MAIGPRLDTERIYLRPLSKADVTQRYVEWLADTLVNRFLETRHELQTLEGTARFVAAKNASADEYLFGIFLKDGDRHVGNIKVGPARAAHKLGEISLFVGDRSVWGQGIATEAIRAASAFAFSGVGLRKLVATMYAGNLGSVSAFLRAGYKEEAVLTSHYLIDGKPSDLRVLARYADGAP